MGNELEKRGKVRVDTDRGKSNEGKVMVENNQWGKAMGNSPSMGKV